MAAESLVVVPPLLKVVSGPLLGPAMVAGAARAAGHAVRVMDLNARWLAEQLDAEALRYTSPFVGDHDRPGAVLRSAERTFTEKWLCANSNDYLRLAMSHDAVLSVARRLARARLGRWIEKCVALTEPPDVVGISVMYAGQVLGALVASIVARSRWPRALVVWGGAHVTALRTEIAADSRYGAVIDRFVFGYAEQTWVDILDAVREDRPLPDAAVTAGGGVAPRARDDVFAVPAFEDLQQHEGRRLTLPAQTSRGCSYGLCSFCTYPSVEGAYRELPLEPTRAVVELARARNAAVSFKDSLLAPSRLVAVRDLIAGRVAWSACTKLSHQLDARFLDGLARSGCATLEVGLETLPPDGQRLINKRQSWELFLRVLDGAERAGIALVVNYMTGLPGASTEVEEAALARVRAALASRRGLVAKVEHNRFELERRAPMATNLPSFVRVTGSWPWSSVLEYDDRQSGRKGSYGSVI